MFLPTVVVLSLCGVVACDTRSCTAEDICRPVPAAVCDINRCTAVNSKDRNNMTRAGLKIYTWNVAQRALNGHCPKVLSSTVGPAYEGEATSVVTFTIKSGTNCSATTLHSFTRKAVIDECTGDVIYEKRDYNGVPFNECFMYFKPGVALVFLKCKDEPPRNGQRCASVLVSEPSSGSCDRSKLNAFVESLGVDYQQEFVDCI